MPGFISFNSYVSDDDEELLVARFDSLEALEAWRTDPEHLQTAGEGSFVLVQGVLDLPEGGKASSTTRVVSRASAIRSSVPMLGVTPPASRRAMAGWVLPIFSASSRWLRPRDSRSWRTRSPSSKARRAHS